MKHKIKVNIRIAPDPAAVSDHQPLVDLFALLLEWDMQDKQLKKGCYSNEKPTRR